MMWLAGSPMPPSLPYTQVEIFTGHQCLLLSRPLYTQRSKTRVRPEIGLLHTSFIVSGLKIVLSIKKS